MEYKIDFHVHSEASPDGLSSLDELSIAAKSRGLYAIAITDHNRFTISEPEIRNGVLMLPACEISTKSGHILALFCKHTFDIDFLNTDGLPTAETAINEIHRNGGLAVIAHPFEKRDWIPGSIHNLLDGAETANSRAFFNNHLANDMASSYAAAHDLISFGGSDAHSAYEIGNSYTIVDAKDVSLIRDSVAAGRCHAVFVRNTPRIRKGLSQFKKAKNSHNLYKILRGIAYILYCTLRDIFGI